MRISWLSADEIAAARQALTAGGAGYDDHFGASGTDRFMPPPELADPKLLDWSGITEHVARAERVSQVVREAGLAAARARFAGTSIAIEAATLAAAAHEGDELGLDEVIGVLSCAIDGYVFYAPFLELMVSLARNQVERAVETYEGFVAAYAQALRDVPHGPERIGAARDGLADFYVSAGRLDDAEALFDRRHEEDQGDVAVALSASRAFLAAGSISHAVRWLGIGAVRAATLGREELASRLRTKQERVRERLS
jgi:tetratricopeptide (TPR) repeat protein